VGRPLWRQVRSVFFSSYRASPAQPFSSLSPTGLMTIFHCLYFWDSPNLEGHVPVFISPRNRVAQLYPRASGLTASGSTKSTFKNYIHTSQETPHLRNKTAYSKYCFGGLWYKDGLDDRGLIPDGDIFLLFETFKLPVEHTQLPTKFGQRLKLTPLHLVQSRMAELYLHSPINLHGVVILAQGQFYR
jgi:hypothetical protein